MPAKPIVVGVIPSRYASHRLPAKPLVDLCGKPMVQRVYEQAKKSRLLDRVVIATDDVRIEEAVLQFGGDVMLTSPDIASGSDRVAAVALHVAGDIFVNIQGDEPLIAPEMIDQGIQLLLDDTSAPVGTLVKQISLLGELLNPNIVKVVLSDGGYAMYFSRSIVPYVRGEADMRQWLEHQTFYKHIGLYIFRREFLLQYAQLPVSQLEMAEKLEQLRILEAGYKIKAGITTYESIPIDTPEDVARVVEILEHTSSGT
ncbi:MAG: 3-deoxy-manno-octulosonate cytidylyltransferase [Ignavibacteriales bacterium]|nr:3-deoxy-manno-octulosonate cytidylyltransferase [Ignavibacteriales bacterium]